VNDPGNPSRDELERRRDEAVEAVSKITTDAVDRGYRRGTLAMQQGAFAGFAMAFVIASLVNTLDHVVSPWWVWPVIAAQAIHLVVWARKLGREAEPPQTSPAFRDRVRSLHQNEVALISLLTTAILAVVAIVV
jgi:hypothetical protein